MREETFTVTEVHCNSCAWMIQTIVGDIDGVGDVSPNQKTNQVTVTFDEAIVEESTIEQTLARAGYPVT